MTSLEKIEKATGRIYTIEDYKVASRKMAQQPSALTDLDIALVEHFGGAKDARAAVHARAGLPAQATQSPTSSPGQDWRQLKKWVTKQLLEVVGPGVGEALRERDKTIKELDDRIVSLQSRIQVLEAKPELKWAGVWSDGQTYAEGSLVTRSGSLWLATSATSLRPGETSAFKLIVKKGEA